jgi:RNA 3'-terminal phosphate cyclase (ATP)
MESPVKNKRKLEPTSDAMVVHIDGSMLEGGGQILRIASSLSAILAKPITVDKIRAGRTKPGLAPQHKTGLELISTLTSGHLTNADIGSTSITLQPSGTLKPMTYIADTKTAGSVCLLAQSALPVMLFTNQLNNKVQSRSKLILKGGTDAAMAPPIDYMHQVLLPILHRHIQPSQSSNPQPLFEIDIKPIKRGFYPRGGGQLELEVTPLPSGASLSPICLNDPGEVRTVKVSAFVAGPHVRREVGVAVLEQAAKVLHKMLPNSRVVGIEGIEDHNSIKTRSPPPPPPPPITIQVLPLVEESKETAVGDGFGCMLTAETSTGCILGSAGVNEEKIGRYGVPLSAGLTMGECAAVELADAVLAGVCVDDYMQDQLIVFMALAKGESVMVCQEPTLHTRTAIEVCREMLTDAVAFEVTGPCAAVAEGGGGELFAGALPKCRRQWTIKCRGAGIIAV